MTSEEERLSDNRGFSGNLILIGMMATGKSAIGTLLAEELGYEMVDLDAEIVRHEGRCIPEIFAENGEVYFRTSESDRLREVLERDRVIVATGGGAVLAAANANLMKEKGIVVALSATAEEIIARVAGDRNRPLLAGNAEENVRRILEERKDAYSFAHCTVDTTGLTEDEVCQRILTHYRVLAFKHV